jgi:hypothetical protein
MKIMKKLTQIRFLILLAGVAFAAVSCAQEDVVRTSKGGEALPVSVQIDTRSPGTPNAGTPADRKVSSLRILIYEKGELKWNFSPEELDTLDDDFENGVEDADTEITLDIVTGTYDFVFIANETSVVHDRFPDERLEVILSDNEQIKTLALLREVKTGHLTEGFTATGEYKPIPMVSHYPGVVVTADEYSVGSVSYPDPFDGGEIKTQATDGGAGNEWDVILNRIGIRLQVDLVLNAGQWETFKEIDVLNGRGRETLHLDNMTMGTWLLSRGDNSFFIWKNNPWSVDAHLPGLTSGVGQVTENSPSAGLTTISYTLILPEHALNAANNTEDNAIKLSALGKSGYISVGPLPDDPTKQDYSIPRNTFLKFTATVRQDEIVFSDIEVIDWGKEEVHITDRGIVVPQTGVHAAPGVLGVNSRTGELTLRGSVVYKGTPVATDKRNPGDADDATLSFGPISSDPVYMVYFQWGSLIGTSSEPDDTSFGREDIAWAPEQYDIQSLMASMTTPGEAAWNEIPFAGSEVQAIAPVWPATDALKGLGDPCVFADGGAFSDWKTPTSDPIPGNSIGMRSWALDAGSPFDIYNQPFDENGEQRSKYGARWIEEGVPTSGAVAGNGSGNPDWSMFLPAAGFRYSSDNSAAVGTVANQGIAGYYWSATPSWNVDLNSWTAHTMYIWDTGTDPTTSTVYRALPIRCVPGAVPQITAHDIEFDYWGGTKDLDVTSFAADGVTPVEWEVVGYDVDGDGYFNEEDDDDTPWIAIDPSNDEDGDTTPFIMAEARENEGSFNSGDQTLRTTAIKGTTAMRHDLSLDLDHPRRMERNTANTYIVNAGGYYKLPLVYGNAIEETKTGMGKENRKSYHVEGATAEQLSDFYGSSGIISSPRITGAVDATLVWSDAPGLVLVQPRITREGGFDFLSFDIPKKTIAQGNALVAVRDTDGKILWSWQIWVTPANNVNALDLDANVVHTTSVNGYGYNIIKDNLGHIPNRLEATYGMKPREMNVRIRQKGIPNPAIGNLVVWQDYGYAEPVQEGNTTYQWGRKDPMPIAGHDLGVMAYGYEIKHYYGNLPGGQLGTYLYSGMGEAPRNIENLSQLVSNPNIYFPYMGPYLGYYFAGATKFNLWDASAKTSRNDVDADVEKTVYDPSPAGYKMPANAAFSGLRSAGSNFDLYPEQGQTTNKIHFPPTPIRTGAGHNNFVGIGIQSMIWTATPYVFGSENNKSNAKLIGMNGADYSSMNYERAWGGIVRPIEDISPIAPPRNFVYAAPGVVGIRASHYEDLKTGRRKISDGTYELTLQGSSTYAKENVPEEYSFIEEKIAPQFGGLADEPVYAVYFKWGSTTAMLGEPGDTWSGMDDVVWADPTFNHGWSIGAAYESVHPSPANTINGDNDIAINRSRGMGDICSYLDGGGKWRTPSGGVAGWQLPGGNKPFSGNLEDYLTTEVETGAGAGNVAIVSADKSIFLPAGGIRDTSGSMTQEGSAGYYWSSTASDYNNSIYYNQGGMGGSALSFSKTILAEHSYTNFIFGYNVRCVSLTPEPKNYAIVVTTTYGAPNNVTKSPGDNQFLPGEQVTLTAPATDPTGYLFEGWELGSGVTHISGTLSGAQPGKEIKVTLNAGFNIGYVTAKYIVAPPGYTGGLWATANLSNQPVPGYEGKYFFEDSSTAYGMQFMWGMNKPHPDAAWAKPYYLTSLAAGTQLITPIISGDKEVYCKDSSWLPENDPCPPGWRVPTRSELDALPNKDSFLPLAGGIADTANSMLTFGQTHHQGTQARYWSRDQYDSNIDATFQYIYNTGDSGRVSSAPKAAWASVRCIRNADDPKK